MNLSIPTDLPVEVRTALETLCQSFSQSLPNQITSILLYGGLAKGEFHPATSDVNVLVVLPAIELSTLDRIAPPIEQARLAIRLNVMVLTEGDLTDSAEVFPTKFLDIQRHHRVLCGRDIAAAFHVPKDRLRRQCARELVNLNLRLRAFYLDRRHRPELIEGTLRRSISTLLINLGLLIELKTGASSTTKAATIDAAAKLGFDPKALETFLNLKLGILKPSPAELKELYNTFMKLVQQAVDLAESLTAP
jgi:predicted nucleotidyltransferase